MNKNELSKIKKQMKINNEYNCDVKDIYNVYCKVDNKNVIYAEKKMFSKLNQEVQEMIFKNCKKLLTGQLDKKLFELSLDAQEGNSTYESLVSIKQLGSLSIKEMDIIVSNIMEHFRCDVDYVVSFVYMSVTTETKKNKHSDDEEIQLENKNDFIFCSINKATTPKKELKIDTVNKELTTTNVLETTINLNPIEGFVFPSITDGYSDVNKVICYASKIDTPNKDFIEAILPTKILMTAEKEKEIFLEALKSIVGGKIKSEDLHDIYKGILDYTFDAEDEDATISAMLIGSMLASKGFKNADNFNNTVKRLTDKDGFKFKVANIVPQKNKDIKITDNNIDISLSCKELNRCRQVVDEGKKYLMIEINDDVRIEGLALTGEKIK